MTEGEVLKKLEDHDKKLDAIFRSAEKTRRYFLWTLIITLGVFVIPLIGLLFIIPKFISIYTNSLNF